MIDTYYGIVHPWHCDVMGHLTTRHYVGMFDDSHPHLFMALGVNQEEMVARDMGFADVKSTLEYRAEVANGALIVIRSTIVKLGGKSFVHRHEMFNRKNDELAASMENITVCFDLATRSAVEVFPEFRAAAEQFMAAEAAQQG